jgi:hypothetical protein
MCLQLHHLVKYLQYLILFLFIKYYLLNLVHIIDRTARVLRRQKMTINGFFRLPDRVQ